MLSFAFAREGKRQNLIELNMNSKIEHMDSENFRIWLHKLKAATHLQSLGVEGIHDTSCKSARHEAVKVNAELPRQTNAFDRECKQCYQAL